MVSVSPASSCVQGLHWELKFPLLTVEQVMAAVMRMGYIDQTHMEQVRIFTAEAGTRLIVIPNTGRTQLRLDIGIPRLQRLYRAIVVAKWIDVAARRIKSSSVKVKAL